MGAEKARRCGGERPLAAPPALPHGESGAPGAAGSRGVFGHGHDGRVQRRGRARQAGHGDAQGFDADSPAEWHLGLEQLRV